jgi:hypothetical protein
VTQSPNVAAPVRACSNLRVPIRNGSARYGARAAHGRALDGRCRSVAQFDTGYGQFVRATEADALMILNGLEVAPQNSLGLVSEIASSPGSSGDVRRGPPTRFRREPDFVSTALRARLSDLVGTCPAEGVPISPGCAFRPSRTVGALLRSLLRERGANSNEGCTT